MHSIIKTIPSTGSTQSTRHIGRRLLRVIGVLCGLLLILALVGSLYESLSESSDARAYPPPGQMVDVGGYRLHLNCIGSGSPTVVIDAGLGDWSTTWSTVQLEVAKTTRVCTYDRAGSGWSEAGPQPRSSQQFGSELHILLSQAAIPGPYVLVGHSLGGLTMRLFVHNYPEDVAGVVLIESMSPGMVAQSPTAIQTPPRSLFSADSIIPGLARVGVVRVLAGPLGLIPHLPPEAEHAYAALMVRPLYFQSFLDETRAIPESMAQAGAVQSFGDLPLIVLSRGLTDAQDAGWQVKQRELLQLSSQSQQFIADQSGHNIEFDQPEAAVEAIVKMIMQLRPGF